MLPLTSDSRESMLFLYC